MNATLQWEVSQSSSIELSMEELVAKLREIAKHTTLDNGVGALIQKQDSQSMVVIIAGTVWGLDWFPIEYNGVGSYHSVSPDIDPEVDNFLLDTSVATYYLCGHHGEIPLQFTVGEESALCAIREFFTSASLPTSIKWDLD